MPSAIDNRLILPLLIPALTAVLTLLAGDRRRLQRALSVAGAVALLTVAILLLIQVWNEGIQVANIGGWAIPFGIVLVADLLSAIMVLLTGIVGLAVVIYSLADIDEAREVFGYHPLFHVLLLGICGAFLTGDMFNLYVWFEVMLISSFVLLTMGGGRAQLEGGIKYVTLNLMASAIFLAALGILYGLTRSLNMADLALKLPTLDPPGLATVLSMLFLVAFGIKAAIFPLFAWLPASYHTPPAAVAAVFAGLLTKVGVYAIIRVFTLFFRQDTAYTHTLILILAGLTMLSGILGALPQTNLRRALSFNLISHIGYMLMGLGLVVGRGALSELALAGSIFYIIHHIITKTTLFMVSGLVNRLRGTYELRLLGSIYRTHPLTAVLFLLPALSLAGIPPLSGFWPKLALLQAALGLEQYAIVVVALLVSLLTLYSMTGLWLEVFWKDRPIATPPLPAIPSRRWLLLIIPVVALVLLIIVIGLGAESVFTVAKAAAGELLDPNVYIERVLPADYLKAFGQ